MRLEADVQCDQVAGVVLAVLLLQPREQLVDVACLAKILLAELHQSVLSFGDVFVAVREDIFDDLL